MNKKVFVVLFLILAMVIFFILQAQPLISQSSFAAKDPGVRSGAPGAGEPIAGLSMTQLAFFAAGRADFGDVEEVADGLGPLMNLDSCGGCHSQPTVGGTSPAANPQVTFATKNGATNRIPSFVTSNGPVREARFMKNPDGSPDGGVHNLFTIAGRQDAPGCVLAQPAFARELDNNNVIFRIPTPVFGAGLIEQIPDSVILANQSANATQKMALGIHGRPNIVLAGSTISGQPNTNGNDGTIARFGWKAQNKSLLLFSGEAYNVEMASPTNCFRRSAMKTRRASSPRLLTMLPTPTPRRSWTRSVQSRSSPSSCASWHRQYLLPPHPVALSRLLAARASLPVPGVPSVTPRHFKQAIRPSKPCVISP